LHYSLKLDVGDGKSWHKYYETAGLVIPEVCCSVLQCVAVCCSVLQCVSACCSVLQCVALFAQVGRGCRQIMAQIL